MTALTRRKLFGTAAGCFAAGCGRRKAEGFPGYAFVANSGGGAVAVVDLEAFAAVRHLRLESDPVSLLTHPARATVYALTPGDAHIHEIDAGALSLARGVACRNGARQMRFGGGGRELWVLSGEELSLVEVAELRLERTIGLGGRAAEFDIAPYGRLAAVSMGDPERVLVVDLETGATVASAEVEGTADRVRFRSDGRQVIVANRARRVLSVLDPASGEWITHLPISVEPEELCFKPDGGQLFVTGKGLDAVVTVHPFETQVASTTLAGRAPGPMAASAEHLYITNPEAGDVTVLDIDTQRLVAVVRAGNNPRFVAVTPDGRYALVLNRDSGDMAVIRVESLTGRRRRSAPLFTMVPVGSQPVHAVVRAI